MKEPKRILVIKREDLSAFVLSLAAMKRIRAAHSRARITLLTDPAFEALARASPYFDEVWGLAGSLGAADAWSLAGRLKREKFDRIYDLDASKATLRLYKALGLFKPAWSGVFKGCTLPHRNPQRDTMHLLERQADQLREAGIWPDAPVRPGSAPPPDFAWLLRRAPERHVPGAVKPRPFVVLAPGGPETRRWPEARFGEVAAKLREAGYDTVVIGGPEHSALARYIQKFDPKARDLTGRSDFSQIAVLGSKAVLAIGNDEGLLHLMAAAGAPTLALIWQGTDPALMGPRGHVAVLHGAQPKDLPTEQVLRMAASLLPAP